MLNQISGAEGVESGAERGQELIGDVELIADI
jgi:hypothetical protein